MEEKLWVNAGGYYRNFSTSRGRRSDHIFAYQLDGEWMARFAGTRARFRGSESTRLADGAREERAHTRYGQSIW